MRCHFLLAAAFLTAGSVVPAADRPHANYGGGGGTPNNVTAAVEPDEDDGDDSLVITGNSANNSILIFDLLNHRIVIGFNGTTVNGTRFSTFSLRSPLDDTFIDMGAGDDTVVVVTAITGDEFVAEGGLGDDEIRALATIDVEEGVELSGFETVIPDDLGM
jgi:hypothetical protein